MVWIWREKPVLQIIRLMPGSPVISLRLSALPGWDSISQKIWETMNLAVDSHYRFGLDLCRQRCAIYQKKNAPYQAACNNAIMTLHLRIIQMLLLYVLSGWMTLVQQ